MDSRLAWEIAAIFALILANGFFSLAEFSVIASRKSKTISISVFENVMKQFDAAAAKLKVDKKIIDFIKMPRRSTMVNLPVRMDDGTYQVFKGFRVQHNDARGPSKGGIRFHPQETR